MHAVEGRTAEVLGRVEPVERLEMLQKPVVIEWPVTVRCRPFLRRFDLGFG